jgi:molybdopterin-guanine dinucleotide biosynthesis protein A
LAAHHRFSFVAACDIPFLDSRLIKKMISAIEDRYAAVVMKTGQYYEPLFSIYSREFALPAENCLQKGIYRVTAPLSLVRWKAVEVDPGEFPDLQKWLLNVNTPEDYEKAKRFNE